MAKWNRQEFWRYSTVGVEYTVTFGLGLAAGIVVDILWNSRPGFMIIGGVIGFLIATRRLARHGREITDEETRRLAEERRERYQREAKLQQERELEELRQAMYREKEGRKDHPAGPAPGRTGASGGTTTGNAD